MEPPLTKAEPTNARHSRATTHQIHCDDARRLAVVEDASVELVVTSPPYPMIEMWDDSFAAQDPSIADVLAQANGSTAFERMHGVLDAVWKEVARVLVEGGIVCVNIGDATRTLGGSFTLFPNHARIVTAFLELGFTPLPVILWRKQTNAPNKFMGSGMLPPGAYVTLEHEYVLIFRKGDKRPFPTSADKANRQASSFFWEERNQWFSDVWLDLKGSRQDLLDKATRNRSGAFPFELPYRLISMFSVKGDTVLDPFLGLGTTALAAMATARNSVGFELEPTFLAVITERVEKVVRLANARIDGRLTDHAKFVRQRHQTKGKFKHCNKHYGFPVVTRQEIGLLLNSLLDVRVAGEPDSGTTFQVDYSNEPQAEHSAAWEHFLTDGPTTLTVESATSGPTTRELSPVQLDLFTPPQASDNS